MSRDAGKTRFVIDLSMNEVETLAMKAARGSGLDWGLAEDAGRAARRLAAAGLDWVAPILSLAGDASPALQGAHLCDAPPDGAVALDPLAHPAFVAAMAAGSGATLRFAWAGGDLTAHDGVLRITVGTGHSETPEPAGRATISPNDLAALEALARATYVPASDTSRLAGAGAGLTDND